ncbi:MAG: PilZ domain-containing protein [Acidobacteriia bacterium]|nr:PilZ domain-containing protein [Terriglobia bacterium]
MANNITVIVAEPKRVQTLKVESHLPGTVLYFSSTNLASALESIRAHAPHIVALESQFAETAEGLAFVTRLHALAVPGCELRSLARVDGRWTTMPLTGSAAALTAAAAVVNTRRAPRFPLLAQAQAVIDGKPTNLVDISTLGAQVVSTPVLRPKQNVKITLPDTNDTVLKFTAHVAWSMFEMPRNASAPQYRAGMEFDGATQQALEEYCRRHCATTPLPQR